MQKFNTKGIVLGRTNYGEAARILTFLTPDHGKVKVLAKGVRKAKSKLAAGVEIFSVSDIGVLKGRGEVDTLISSRLVKHYGDIVKHLDRTNLAYELIKKLDKATADQPEAAYFKLLENALEVLAAEQARLGLIEAWFSAQLLKLSGRAPNLKTDKAGFKLSVEEKYEFNYDSMSFEPGEAFGPNQIKYLRLLFSDTSPGVLNRIEAGQKDQRLVERLILSLAESF